LLNSRPALRPSSSRENLLDGLLVPAHFTLPLVGFLDDVNLESLALVAPHHVETLRHVAAN